MQDIPLNMLPAEHMLGADMQSSNSFPKHEDVVSDLLTPEESHAFAVTWLTLIHKIVANKNMPPKVQRDALKAANKLRKIPWVNEEVDAILAAHNTGA